MNNSSPTSPSLFGFFVFVAITLIIFLCSDGNSQPCDKLFEFTYSGETEMIMGSTPELKGVYECTNVGTNIKFTEDTLYFIICVKRGKEKPELFGEYIVLPSGQCIVKPTLFMVIDECIIVGCGENTPIGTKFFICLREIFSVEEALLHK